MDGNQLKCSALKRSLTDSSKVKGWFCKWSLLVRVKLTEAKIVSPALMGVIQYGYTSRSLLRKPAFIHFTDDKLDFL